MAGAPGGTGDDTKGYRDRQPRDGEIVKTYDEMSEYDVERCDDHPDTLTSRNNLAYAYRAAGDLDRAIPLNEQTLADSVRVLGVGHPQTKIVRGNLTAARQHPQ